MEGVVIEKLIKNEKNLSANTEVLHIFREGKQVNSGKRLTTNFCFNFIIVSMSTACWAPNP